MSRFARPLPAALAGALAALLLGLAAPAAAAPWSGTARAGRPGTAMWRWPVGGAIVRPFDYDAGRPFAAGARRGVDLRSGRAALVRAPCAGRVTYAGGVPGRGRGVTVRCGAFVATVLGLAAGGVHRGAHVRPGDPIGLAAGATVRLGARRAHERFGYVDPASLVGGAGGAAAPPLGGAPRGRPPGGRSRPAADPRSVRAAWPQAITRAQATSRPQATSRRQAAARVAAGAAILLLAAAVGTGIGTRSPLRPRRRARTRARAHTGSRRPRNAAESSR